MLPTAAKLRVLRVIEGETIRGACRVLAMSPNGVHQHLREARDAGWAETTGRRAGWRLTAEGRRIVRLAEQIERAP